MKWNLIINKYTSVDPGVHLTVTSRLSSTTKIIRISGAILFIVPWP